MRESDDALQLRPTFSVTTAVAAVPRRRARATMGKHPAHESSVGVLHYPALLGALGVLLLGLCEALQLAAATPLCRPLCLVLLGVGLVGHRCALLVRARGGPIAFLPPDWRDWVLESTPLDAAEAVLRVVDFQHWLGVFIHCASALGALDAEEKAAFVEELPPRVRDWVTTPGLLRVAPPLHAALVWRPVEPPPRRPSRAPSAAPRHRRPGAATTTDVATFMRSFNPWPMLMKIFGRRAHRTLRRNLPASRLALAAGAASAAAAAQLAASPRARDLCRRGAANAALGATVAAAVGSLAALAGVHGVRFDDLPDDDDDDVDGDEPRRRESWGVVAPAAALSLASLVASAYAASKASIAPSFQTTVWNCVAGALSHVTPRLAAVDGDAEEFSAATS